MDSSSSDSENEAVLTNISIKQKKYIEQNKNQIWHDPINTQDFPPSVPPQKFKNKRVFENAQPEQVRNKTLQNLQKKFDKSSAQLENEYVSKLPSRTKTKQKAPTLIKHHKNASRTKINLPLANKLQFVGIPKKGIAQYLYITEQAELVKATGKFPKIEKRSDVKRPRKK